MGNSDSIDISLSNLYKVWYELRREKRASEEVNKFQFTLEANLERLAFKLDNRTYTHQGYTRYIVLDSKKREIAVAAVVDRVIHRLLYSYLESAWDRVFIFDAWSCRKGKGQHLAISRALGYMQRYKQDWVWRADITKFFDTVDQTILWRLVQRRVTCPTTLWLIQEVLNSYYKNQPGKGMPIGNLTSQIFANIYLNEFDRYMVHTLKPLGYLRYGDDWLCFASSKHEIEQIRTAAINFITMELKLEISKKLNVVTPVRKGVTYLGVDLWPSGTRIMKATQSRVLMRLTAANYSSYEAHIRKFSNIRTVKRFYWRTLDI